MKIRTDFVTNSSSSSFVCYKIRESEKPKEIKAAETVDNIMNKYDYYGRHPYCFEPSDDKPYLSAYTQVSLVYYDDPGAFRIDESSGYDPEDFMVYDDYEDEYDRTCVGNDDSFRALISIIEGRCEIGRLDVVPHHILDEEYSDEELEQIYDESHLHHCSKEDFIALYKSLLTLREGRKIDYEYSVGNTD